MKAITTILLICIGLSVQAQLYFPTGKGWKYTPKIQNDSLQVKDYFKFDQEIFKWTDTPQDGQYIMRRQQPDGSHVWTNYTISTPTQVNADWNATTGAAQILNKPTFRTVNGQSVVGIGDIGITAGETVTASNGLTKTGSNIALGGTLPQANTILGSYGTGTYGQRLYSDFQNTATRKVMERAVALPFNGTETGTFVLNQMNTYKVGANTYSEYNNILSCIDVVGIQGLSSIGGKMSTYNGDNLLNVDWGVNNVFGDHSLGITMSLYPDDYFEYYFYSSKGEDYLKINLPKQYTAYNDRYMPLSVNGQYADEAGNIQIETGGGTAPTGTLKVASSPDLTDIEEINWGDTVILQDNYVTAAEFNQASSTISLERNNDLTPLDIILPTIKVASSQALTDISTIALGDTVVLEDNYPTALSFNQTNNTLTMTRNNGQAPLSVVIPNTGEGPTGTIKVASSEDMTDISEVALGDTIILQDNYVTDLIYSDATKLLTLYQNNGLGTISTTLPSGGEPVTADNGINRDINNIQLGGPLTRTETVIGSPIDGYVDDIKLMLYRDENERNITHTSTASLTNNTNGAKAEQITRSQTGTNLAYANSTLFTNLIDGTGFEGYSEINASGTIDNSTFSGASTRVKVAGGFQNNTGIYMTAYKTSSELSISKQKGSDILQLNFPTVFTGAEIKYMPVSVNGQYADAAGNITVSAGSTVNTTVQALSGTTVAWNVTNGVNARITLTGATTITLSNLVAGTTGNLTVINGAPETAYTLNFAGYTNKISPAVYSAANRVKTSGLSRIDCFSWYYDGVNLIWNGTNDYN